MNPVLRRFIVLGTPLILGALLTTHPVFSGPIGIYHGILSRPDWWLTIHILLLPLFYLIALAAYLLIDGVQGVAATISKVALGVFVIFYPAFDVLIGIGTGILVRYAAGSPSSQQVVIEKAVIAFLYSPIANLFVLLGSFGWEVGVLAAAIALSRPIRSRLLVAILILLALLFPAWNLLLGFATPTWWIAVLTISILFGFAVTPHLLASLLVLASFFFGASHVPPLGPLGMACFFLAALQHELLQLKSVPAESAANLTESIWD